MFRRTFRRTGRKSASAIQVFTKSKSAAPQDARERTLRAILGRDLLRHTQQNRTLCVRATPRRAFSLQERLENQQMRAWVCTSLFSLAYLFVFVAMVKVAQPFAERQLNDLAQVVAESERPRAPIVDRNGQVLAQDLPSFSLYANPRVLRKPTETARALTRIFPELGLTALTERLNSDKSFVWVRRHISPRSYEAVLALGEPGLEVIRDRRRGYPLGGLAPHVVGITDPDRHGLSGMERAFDEPLARFNRASGFVFGSAGAARPQRRTATGVVAVFGQGRFRGGCGRDERGDFGNDFFARLRPEPPRPYQRSDRV